MPQPRGLKRLWVPDLPPRVQPLVGVGCIVLVGVVFVLDLMTPRGIDVAALYTLAILSGLLLPGRLPAVFITAGSSVLIILGWFWSPQAAAPAAFGVLNRSTLAGLLWVVTLLGLVVKKRTELLLESQEREREALKQEVAVHRTLAAEQFHTLVESSPDGIVVSDPAGRITLVNRQAEVLFGYDREDLVGQPVELVVPEAARGGHVGWRGLYQNEPVRRPMAEGRILRGRRSTGEEFPVEILLSPMPSPEGTLVIAAIRDVTRRELLENSLRQAQKMEAVGQLTGGIAHDLNNVLTVVITNAELALAQLPPGADEVRRDLTEMLGVAQRGAGMIRRLLNFSRRELLTIRPVAPGPLLADIARMLRRVIPETVVIETQMEPDLPAIRADASAVEQILVNLATNARDAMPEGGTLRIEAHLHHLDAGYHATHPWVEPGDYVCVTVSDTGIGMTQETLSHVFEPFFTTKPAGIGTGLGLSMVYGVVKQHGGMVHVYSEPGQGTAVKVCFPVVSDAPEATGAAVDREEPAPGGSEVILLAEDDAAIRRASRRVLEGQGYQVLIAQDGEEALEVLHAHADQVRLIITDLVMPKLGGRQLYDALQAEGNRIPILFTSGYSPTTAATARPPEVPLLRKPWTVRELLTTVRRLLDRESPPPSAP